MNKIVLAYSGGLDTSAILVWLKERYPGVKVVAYSAQIGVGDEFNDLEAKAKMCGADEVHILDLRKEFAKDYCFPLLRSGGVYEKKYLLGTSIARPITAKYQVKIAHDTGADAVAHGCTGKGNDQVRFELTYMALDSKLKIISPWKDPEFKLTSRESVMEYVEQKGIPIDKKRTKYSRDRNLWHISHEGGDLEDANSEPSEDMWVMSRPVAETPNNSEYLNIEFISGNPVSINGITLEPHEIIEKLNQMGGIHGVGQIHLVENRLVGMKSRGAYETPGGTILFEAHSALEQLCLERETMHFKELISNKYAELVYYGQWFHPLREALQQFIDHTQIYVSGNVTLKLFKGKVTAVSVESKNSLYDPKLASFSMENYDIRAARGFIDIFGLPMKMHALRGKLE